MDVLDSNLASKARAFVEEFQAELKEGETLFLSMSSSSSGIHVAWTAPGYEAASTRSLIDQMVSVTPPAIAGVHRKDL